MSRVAHAIREHADRGALPRDRRRTSDYSLLGNGLSSFLLVLEKARAPPGAKQGIQPLARLAGYRKNAENE